MNFCSNPTDLKITDMRFVDIDGAPKRCTILRIDTNQGISGFGEVRDASSKTYALMLKSRILGENPCNVDKIFRKIKQFGGPSRQGGGVSGIEIALWDLAGKAYGVPLYQLLGGKFRDEVRVDCDTDVDGKHTGYDMGMALKKRMEMGFTFLKMDLGIGLLLDEPGTLNAPLGFIDDMKRARFLGMDYSAPIENWFYNITPIPGKTKPFVAGNYSPTEIQALGLRLQVARNEEIIEARRKAAAYLSDRFANNPAIIAQDIGNEEIKPTFHLYLLQIDPEKAGGTIQDLKKKLEKKNADMIIANNLKVAGAGFGTDTNVVTLITRDEVKEYELMGKDEVAKTIVDYILTK